MMYFRFGLRTFDHNISSDAVLFSLQPISHHMVSIGPVSGDITFDFFPNMVSARCRYCKITLFYCSKYLVGRYFETMLVSSFNVFIYLLMSVYPFSLLLTFLLKSILNVHQKFYETSCHLELL